jgi:hypothetical protein
VPSTGPHGETTSGAGPRLHGRAADLARRAAERREAAEEHLAEFTAFARLMVAALGGIDVVRSRLGREDALRVAALAGLPVEQIAGQWSAADPVGQVSRVRPDAGYDQDPSHDQRVIDSIMSGADMEEVGKVRARVTSEYQQRAAAASARTAERSDLGIPGVAYDGSGAPVQRSGPGNTNGDWDAINHRVIPRSRKSDIWHDLPDHQAGFQDRVSPGIGSSGMPAPAPGQAVPGAVTDVLDRPAAACPESRDSRHRGGSFCMYCGGSLTGQQQD